MAEIVLDVESRDVKKEKNDKLRSAGIVPAIVYGAGKENKAIKLDKKIFIKKMNNRFLSNIFIDLKIDNENAPSKTVFIKKIQREDFSREIEHVDFIEIDPNKKIHLSIPIVLEGTAAGIVAGGLVEFTLRFLEIECLPKDTPKEIKVDITSLEVGQSIHVSDIKLSSEVRIVTRGEIGIVSVVERKEEVVAAPTAEAAAAAPAVGADGKPVAAAPAADAKAGDAKAAPAADAKAAPKAEGKKK